MKPAPFTYHRPADLAEALDVLAEVGAEGKVLAGGQSLLPLLSMRLASPAHLVDVNRLAGLDTVAVVDDPGAAGGRAVRVGALVRHAGLEHDPGAYDVLPLLRQALGNVAHATIRNRGTTVGSICHADPAAELPAVLALLGGTVVARSTAGERRVDAGSFFAGPLESDLRPDELAVAVEFRLPAPGTRTAVVELARRHGDYAMCGVVAAVRLDGDGAVASARTSYVSVGQTPPVLDLTEVVAGRAAPDAPWSDAGALARERLETDADIHASADYRAHLVAVLTERALRAAVLGRTREEAA